MVARHWAGFSAHVLLVNNHSIMKKVFLVFLIILLIGSSANAQLAKEKLVFRSYNTFQHLYGQSTISGSLHSVNGFQFNRIFAGLGTGIDAYYFNTITLFAEFRYNLAPKGKALQLYANAGLHIPFSSHNREVSQKPGDFNVAPLLAAGIDYYVPVKNNAFIAGVGYSKKQVWQLVENNVWDPETSRVNNIPVKDRYDFNRIYIKIGWVF
jgi:hypothetical protein